ncbi:hypothetical protein ACSSS7_007725 [Eimeria intestinalis]
MIVPATAIKATAAAVRAAAAAAAAAIKAERSTSGRSRSNGNSNSNGSSTTNGRRTTSSSESRSSNTCSHSLRQHQASDSTQVGGLTVTLIRAAAMGNPACWQEGETSQQQQQRSTQEAAVGSTAATAAAAVVAASAAAAGFTCSWLGLPLSKEMEANRLKTCKASFSSKESSPSKTPDKKLNHRKQEDADALPPAPSPAPPAARREAGICSTGQVYRQQVSEKTDKATIAAKATMALRSPLERGGRRKEPTTTCNAMLVLMAQGSRAPPWLHPARLLHAEASH